ncbi:MFS transporter [Alkaliphilus peptidifermentans]|uniref:Major Facilitator Superfamily protein n=1 Tax=Alkaliphilus peptidifermentans DSM 18978 TaxID=1120976 RepID=A0A1G5H862_9FIRM|nr:MFS transporter [Alkaliphilus peptidifermentans]SCY59904.1 Major Facilitator Superfamily protein [Alkaliphilus peptidifermentans DSM 18978]
MIFNNRNFTLYTMGRFISIIGSGIQDIAIILYILDITKSGTMVGILGLMSTIPRLILLPISGVIGDVWNRKYIMVVTDLANGILVLTLFILTMLGHTNMIIIFIVQAILSMLSIIFRCATRAMIPELVADKELAKSNATIKGIENFTQVMAPILGAIIYGLGGIKIVFLINGISFILSGLSECFIKYNRSKVEENVSIINSYEKFLEGFRFIKRNEGIKQICYLYTFSSTLIIPLISVVIPFVLKEVIKFSDYQFSILQSSYVVGMFIGSIAIGTLLSNLKERSIIRLGLFSSIIIVIIFTLIVSPFAIKYFKEFILSYMILVGLVLAIMGGIDIIYDTPVETNLQRMIPNNMRSRVLATTQFIFGLGIPLGQAVFGFLLDKVSVFSVLGILSVVYAIGVLIFLINATEDVYGTELIST